MTQIRVADVSRWQGIINWDIFRQNIDAVIIKMSGADGGLYPDGLGVRNRDEARRVGLPRGFYHYKGYGVSGRDQAEYFLAQIGTLLPGEVIVLDDENESSVNAQVCKEFNDRVRDILGINQIVYSNQSRFQAAGDNLKLLADNNMAAWVAKYGINDGTLAGAGSLGNIPHMSVVMHQYTSMARIPGVTANTVDMNVFFGTVEQFLAYGVQGEINLPVPPVSAPVPQPAPVPVMEVYTVQPRDYDGLAAAMRRVGISNWQEVASINGLGSPYVIKVGDQLRLKRPVIAAPETGTYTVTGRDSDGLMAAMARIGINNWRTVAEHNGLSEPFTIYPGQILRLPGGTPSTSNTRAYYIVKSSDSDGLSAAMSRIGINNWQRVAQLNGLNDPYIIKANDKLWLN